MRRYLTDGAWGHAYDMHPAELLAAEINADDDARACPTAVPIARDSSVSLLACACSPC